MNASSADPGNPIPGVVYPSAEDARRYLYSGAWDHRTVGQVLAETAARRPDAIAMSSDESRITFAVLDERTDRVAAALLRLGFVPGDRALFQLGTTPETVIALVACFKAGIVPVCAVPQYREIEMGQLARLSRAVGHFVQADAGAFDLVGFARTLADAHPALVNRIVVRGNAGAGESSLALLKAAMSIEEARRRLAQVSIGPRDVLSFQLSGGTTGVPKIIPRFHGEYLGQAAATARRFGYDTADGSTLWNLPLIHNAGQICVVMPCLLYGRTIHLQPRVDIRAYCAAIERHWVTHALSIGPLAPQLLAYPDLHRHDLSSIRVFVSMTRAETLEQSLGVPVVHLYGITEGLVLGLHPTDPVEARHRINGRSGCSDDQIEVRDPDTGATVAPGRAGELCFRGPSSLRAYFEDAAATAAAVDRDGFVRTGDMVIAHDIGGERYWSFEGRLRDNVNRGGEKYGCEEVEALLGRHPAIADAKVVPMPDPIYGEKGCAFIVLRPGASAPTVDDTAAFLVRAGLAKFKCPERIEVLEQFPVTRVGKVDKPALRRWIARRQAADAPDRGEPTGSAA